MKRVEQEEAIRNLARCVLLSSVASPWSKLYSSGNDAALITVTGHDHSAFAFMLERFLPYFDGYSPWVGNCDGRNYKKLNPLENRRRKRDATGAACLGLTLAWYRFKGSEFILQGWFGFTGGQMRVWLRFGRRVLLKCLLSIPECRVKYPTDEKIADLKSAIHEQNSPLPDVYCVCDGLKLSYQAPGTLLQQDKFYNGWTHGHYVTNLFVFSPDGYIIDAVLNVPGSVHDSTLAIWGGVYDKLKTIYKRTGGVCCIDLAFAAGNAKYLLKSSQDPHKAKDKAELVRMHEANSLRQAAEWGMRAVQKSIPRLKDTIHHETSGERRLLLKLGPFLYNLRV